MKARVYGWAVESVNKGLMHCNGCVQEFSDKACVGDWCVFYSDGIAYSVHEKQIEPIKQITITEEEFEKICNKCCFVNCDNQKYVYINEIKEELFKDVK